MPDTNHFSGEITIDPPLTWAEVQAGPAVSAVELRLHEEVTDTAAGQVKTITAVAVQVPHEWCRRDEIVRDLQAIVDRHRAVHPRRGAVDPRGAAADVAVPPVAARGEPDRPPGPRVLDLAVREARVLAAGDRARVLLEARAPGRRLMRRTPPLVGITALYATITGLEGNCQVDFPHQPAWHVPPEQAHVLLDSGPLVDIRATATAYPEFSAPHECRWVVTVLAFYEDDAVPAMDEALQQLRSDIRGGRVAKGTHTGPPWPRNPLEPPAEALLQQFRESVLGVLERSAA